MPRPLIMEVTELCGTHEDILIPSSCLNSTVSGLVSRTFLREDIIGEKDFHGAVFYEELRPDPAFRTLPEFRQVSLPAFRTPLGFRQFLL